MSLLQSLLFLLILFSHAASVHLPIFRRSSPRTAEEEALTAKRRSGFSNQVFSGYYLNSGIYYTRIGIGTPPTYIDLELDTGSDIIWIQCDPCPRCSHQVNSSVFKPHRSRSYVPARCGGHLCHHLNEAWCESYGPSCPQNFSYGAGCDARSQSCLFMTSYTGGLSKTTGEFAMETLTSGKGVHLPGIALGCAHDMYRISSAGILGLGRGSLSFSSQLASIAGRRRFSLCLGDFTSSPPGHSSSASSLIFGNSAVPNSTVQVVYVPMVQNRINILSFYYVDVTGISFGGRRLGISPSHLVLNPVTGEGGVIIDSGTTITQLTPPVYEAVRDALKEWMSGLNATRAGSAAELDTCYDLNGRDEEKVMKTMPTMALHFSNGATLPLPVKNYFIDQTGRGIYCLYMMSNGRTRRFSILGNMLLQGIRIVFDVEMSQVGFFPGAC